jgi:hypothetical protein
MNYLEIPCMGKISFGDEITFDVLAGAYVGYLLSAKQSTDNGKLNMPGDTTYKAFYGPEPKTIDYPIHNVRSDYTTFNSGVLVGMSVTIHDKVTLEVRLNRGLVNINKMGSAKINTIQTQVSVGWYMFRHKKKV